MAGTAQPANSSRRLPLSPRLRRCRTVHGPPSASSAMDLLRDRASAVPLRVGVSASAARTQSFGQRVRRVARMRRLGPHRQRLLLMRACVLGLLLLWRHPPARLGDREGAGESGARERLERRERRELDRGRPKKRGVEGGIVGTQGIRSGGRKSTGIESRRKRTTRTGGWGRWSTSESTLEKSS